MIDNFSKVIDLVLEAEGGYNDYKNDTPTNFGITLQTLTFWRAETEPQAVTSDDVKNLTRQEATAIYRSMYWDRLGLNKIESWKIAYMIFDQAVNRGPLQAIKSAQMVLHDLDSKVAVDGILGSETSDILNATYATDAFDFCLRYSHICELEYMHIVTMKPEKFVFLPGWWNRIHNSVMACWSSDV